MKFLLVIFSFFAFYMAKAQEKEALSIHFEFNEAKLTPAAKDQLLAFISSLQKGNRMTLHGHTDLIGSQEYNEALSSKRVKAVHAFLLENGVLAPQILDALAHGEYFPLNENLTEEERRLNRRVTIMILEDRLESNLPGLVDSEAPDSIKTLSEQLSDTLLVEGSTIALSNINFIGGMAKIVPESRASLMELLDVMKEHPNLAIEIQGHICCQDGPGDGIDLETGIRNLSVERAKTVYEFLSTNGIAKERISYRGFGHSRPIYPFPERTEFEGIANRRVEIKIIRK